MIATQPLLRCFACIAALALACAQPARAIMAGDEPDTPADRVDANTPDSVWSGVGSVVVDGHAYGGAAVSPRWVLTAAHVVGGKGPAAIQFVVNVDGGPRHAGEPADSSGHGQAIAVERVAVYPGAHFPYDDYALLRLAEPLPAGAAWYPVADVPVALGTVIRLVGYGASGHGDSAPSVGASPTVKRKGENVIDALPSSVDASGRTSRFFLYDFDGPSGNGPLGGPTLGNARESTVAGGDSGSGVFAQIGGRWALVGISTFAAKLGDGQPQSSRFGSIGGGVLLSDPKVVAWVDGVTDRAVKWVSKRPGT